MNLQSIADIHDEISVLMPSGMPATLCVCDDGIIVDYGQGIKDTYSTDEFGKIVADGIQVFEKPSQMVIEDFNNKDHIEKQNKLDRIVKYNKDTKNRQIARGLLDRLNLGADDDKEIEKFVKKANKNEKLEIKRNKTMDIKDVNKVLESYIEDETHDNILELAQQQMKPEEIDHHQSDLYLKKTPISDKLIANYRWKNSVTTFRDNIDNELWYEIPFAYGHKVRESYINEISDETVHSVENKRKDNLKNWKNDEIHYWKEYRKARNHFDQVDKQSPIHRNTKEFEQAENDFNYADKQWDNARTQLSKSKDKLDKFNRLKINRDLKKFKKDESKINEANYDSQGDAWYNFCKNVKNYAKEHGVDIDEAIYQELDDMVYFSDVINVWTNMPGNLGSRESEIVDLMREDIQEGAFDEIEYIEDLDESKINEISDELKGRALGKRIAQARKANKKFMNKYPNNQISIDKNDPRAEEWLKDSDDSMEKTKKARRLYGKVVKEAFEDNMLTDINDLDFPQALQDTVETDDEGELITLGKVADEIKNLKDELVDEIKDIKDDLKDEINDIKQDMQDEVSDELSDEELADIEDIEFEDVPMEVEEPNEETEETEEIETEEIDEPEKTEKEEKEEKETDEDKEDKEDKIEESFKKYITKGKYEDLAQTKREVDKLTQQGKDAKEIKDTITLLADDEKEEDEAEKYAVSKLKESLLATSRTSKLNNL